MKNKEVKNGQIRKSEKPSVRYNKIIIIASMCLGIGIIIMLVVIMNQSTNHTDSDKGSAYFEAIVLEMGKDSIIVQPFENEYVKEDKVEINAKVISTDGLPDMQIGDKIRVVFNPESVSQDSDRMKINIVFSVYKK